MKAHLIRDFRTFHSYFHSLTGMENSLGLIPDFFADFDWNGKHHLEYSSFTINTRGKFIGEIVLSHRSASRTCQHRYRDLPGIRNEWTTRTS